MDIIEDTLRVAASAVGIDPQVMAAPMVARARSRHFPPGQWLFQEGSEREWFGLIEAGEVEIVHGRHGDPRVVTVLGPGAMLSETLLVDGASPHSCSARTATGARVLVLDRAAVDEVRRTEPVTFAGMVTRAAQRLADRLRHATERLAGEEEPGRTMCTTRIEHDLLGEREVPSTAYYGVQTLRAMENFPISGTRLYQFGHLVTALAHVKKAAAMANAELGVLDPGKRDAIVAACDEIAAGQLRREFVVDMVQGGAGTSTNMNANEVIANRALELLGHERGQYQFLHPNDDVNCSQSTNDAYPTALKIAVIRTTRETLAALDLLVEALAAKAAEFSDVLKMGRTENQDAVPMTLGQEFGAYAGMVRSARTALAQATDELHAVNMGATAIGTGLNSPPGYARLVVRRLAEVSGVPVRLAGDLVEATQDSGAFAHFSAAKKRAAIQISKICKDLRWLSSGPRTGLNEINLPPMQPGSSIMPGKVNPVIPEVVNQVCYQIIGFDSTISMAAEATDLELNMAEPIIGFDLLSGLTMLGNACIVLATRCVAGITANREVCRDYVQRSIGLVTALNPVLGYERSVAIAKEALETGSSVYDLVVRNGWLSVQALDELLDPANMTNPRELPRQALAT